jgi:EAL domain-containing protein (putative c-di-GMP-specific phosphodiesterase class I)/ActR/RegA family two-component response regulator
VKFANGIAFNQVKLDLNQTSLWVVLQEPLDVNVSKTYGNDLFMKVLIADDHVFQRRALSSMIATLGGSYQVYHASDGNEAMRLMAAIAPDIIICDLAMPNMDGLALLGQLAAQKYKGSVLLSSASDSSLLRAAANLVDTFGLSLLGVMPKPSSVRQLNYFFQQYQNRLIPAKEQIYPDVDTHYDILKQALNEEQFISAFQPQIDFSSGECIGLEVLCRWQHPTKGLLSPYYFIVQVEQAGLMPALTIAMIAHAVTALNALPSPFLQVKLSINLSASCLTNDFITCILDNKALMALARCHRVTFEVTEQTPLPRGGSSLELLSRLRLHGFNLSVDDFGTGYSSLQQLSRYPFNEIKIDRSFVSQALNDTHAATISTMAIQLAKKLNLKVVVEGVETHQQWQYMKELGANTCQGFYCAKPMPIHQIPHWYSQWQLQYQAITAQLNLEEQEYN